MSHLFVTAETGPLACIDSACLAPNRGLIAGIEGSGAGFAILEDGGGMGMEMGMCTRLSLFGWVVDGLSDLPFRKG